LHSLPGEDREKIAAVMTTLHLEHMQVREAAAMIRRLLDEKNDLEGARRLAPNLARRWDAHTTREERDLFRDSKRGLGGSEHRDPDGALAGAVELD
jgi:hypothetical protein